MKSKEAIEFVHQQGIALEKAMDTGVITEFVDGTEKVFLTSYGGKLTETRVQLHDALPTHIKCQRELTTIASFSEYINRYGNSDSALTVLDANARFCVHADIDFHSKDLAGRREHQAVLTIRATDEFGTLADGLGNQMTQQGTALWLEKIIDMVAQPKDDLDVPTAMDIQALIQSLTVNHSSKASTEMNSNQSINRISYESETKTDTVLPDYFVVAVKMFEEQAQTVGVKVRPMVIVGEDQKPYLVFRAPSLQSVIKEAKDEMKQQLRDSLTVENIYLYE